MALGAALLAEVPEGAILTIDSAPIIYFFEDHPVYAELFGPLFDAVAEGRITAVISPITLAEVLSGPLGSNDEVRVSRYREALCRTPGWHTRSVDEEVAVSAARLRVRYNIRLPDAIQVATAIASGSHAFVTHDKRLMKIKDIAIIGPK